MFHKYLNSIIFNVYCISKFNWKVVIIAKFFEDSFRKIHFTEHQILYFFQRLKTFYLPIHLYFLQKQTNPNNVQCLLHSCNQICYGQMKIVLDEFSMQADFNINIQKAIPRFNTRKRYSTVKKRKVYIRYLLGFY